MNAVRFTNWFSEKNYLLGQVGHFGPKNCTSSQLWICCKDFFEILLNERGQEVVHGNYIYCFSEKNSHSGQMGHFRFKDIACS